MKFVIVLICILCFNTSVKSQIRDIDKPKIIENESFSINDAKLIFGTTQFDIQDFLVIKGFIVINNIPNGSLLLLSPKDNIVLDEYNYIKSIRRLKYKEKPFTAKIKKDKDGVVILDQSTIKTPFLGKNHSMIQVNDSTFFVNLIRVGRKVKLFSVKISGNKLVPIFTDYPSKDTFQKMMGTENLDFNSRAYNDDLYFYSKYEDIDYFSFSSRLSYDPNQLPLADRKVNVDNDTLFYGVNYTDTYIFENNIVKQYRITTQSYNQNLEIIQDKGFLYMIDDTLLKLYSKSTLVSSINIDSSKATDNILSKEYYGLHKDYTTNQMLFFRYSLRDKLITVSAINYNSESQNLQLNMITKIKLNNPFRIICVDRGCAYFSTLSKFTSGKYIYKVDLYSKNDLLIRTNEQLTYMSSNPYNFNFSSKKSSNEGFVCKDDYTLLKERELKKIQKYNVIQNFEEYPQSNIKELISSLLKCQVNKKVLYPLYLIAINKDNYRSFRKELDTLFDNYTGDDNKYFEHDNNKSNGDFVNYMELYQELLDHYDEVHFELLESVIVGLYKEYKFVFIEINGKYYMDSAIRRTISVR